MSTNIYWLRPEQNKAFKYSSFGIFSWNCVSFKKNPISEWHFTQDWGNKSIFLWENTITANTMFGTYLWLIILQNLKQLNPFEYYANYPRF